MLNRINRRSTARNLRELTRVTVFHFVSSFLIFLSFNFLSNLSRDAVSSNVSVLSGVSIMYRLVSVTS